MKLVLDTSDLQRIEEVLESLSDHPLTDIGGKWILEHDDVFEQRGAPTLLVCRNSSAPSD